MSRHEFRSNHEELPLFTPPQGAKRRSLKRSAKVSVAVAALSSIVLGSQAATMAQAQAPDDAGSNGAGEVGAKAPGNQSPNRSASRVTATNGARYLVLVGDTVQDIAQAHGVTTAHLLAANGLSWKTLIFAGQQLTIPITSGTMPSAHVGETIMRHNVKSGDTLKAIAEDYGVPALAIMTANGLDRSSRLVVGQRLVIPDATLMSGLPAVS